VNPFPFVLAEWRHSRSTLSAMALLVAVGCAITLGVTSVERALRQASARAADRFDLIVGASGSETQLVLTTVYLQPAALKLVPFEVLNQLRADPGVVEATPIATGDSFAGFPIVGSTPEFASNHGKIGLELGRWFNQNNEAVVGAATSLQVGDSYTPLHGSANENAIEAHEHAGQHVKVVGRMLPTGTPWDRAILVPFEAVLELHEHSHSHVGIPAIVVKPRSVMDAYRLRNTYRTDLTTAVFPAETLTSLYRTLGDVRELALWIASAGQLLVLLAVLLGLYATLTARAQALVALRAIGASRLYLWLALWLQAMIMLLSGIVGAVVGGYLVAWGASRVLSGRLGLSVKAGLALEDLWTLLAILVVGALASALVAWRVYRLPLSAALR
jgi:putative ABC transport system permease protein